MDTVRKLSILGSTGSIGVSTLEVAGRYPDRFEVVALAAGRNADGLEEQIRKFRPKLVSLTDASAAASLRTRLNGLNVEIRSGIEGLIAVAEMSETDMVISAIVGAAGLVPTMAAIRAGKKVALANKETLVMAGEIVMREVRERCVELFPVDSEHSAIFQSMHGQRREDIRRLIITASGGPFLDTSEAGLREVTAAQALRHPNWSMGKKITIDSATLMNKGLEVIEAHWLFDVPSERIDVVIHPQSIIHSMVEYCDGSVIAQMGVPDMKGPISYALGYPKRLEETGIGLDLVKIGSLTFREPDLDRFPCLRYAYDSLREGGTMPAVLNAANEVAVQAFLDGRAGFMDIPRVIRATMDHHRNTAADSIEGVLNADRWAREEANRQLQL
ncbi:MAG: 1-deoxy-D-xylulose-5-phosphate reductoisomerase [Nitrospirota bacterium]|nr:1-deoxy-D-xylulose-5-phosphate reductoisomerase [Nitrospirota bacterium]